ncbi:MAG: PDZ domain-containing protein [Pseudomonadota bacterium]
MPAPVHYRLTTPHPERHVFVLELTLESDVDTLHFSLPDWVPGSYMIRDYARHIVAIDAYVDGEAVALEKRGKSRWQLSAARGSVRLVYHVYALDHSVRGAYLDTSGWFCQGVCVFLRCEEAAEQLHRVVVESELTSGDQSLVTTLPADTEADRAAACYLAESYGELIDHPIMAGSLQSHRFDVFGVPHEVVVAGRCELDAERLLADIAAICETHVRCFGEPPPMQRYVFMLRVGGERSGGLEHRDSCVLAVPRRNLSRGAARDAYIDFLSLVSHEYFHAWLVKRIRPAALARATLHSEVHTRSLWVFEGITSYYDELGLLRAGVIEPSEYLKRLAATLSRVQRGVGRLRQSLEDASYDTWTRFYKQDENAPNAIVSYYTKGALVALALDLVLRQRSQGRLSLDTVMRVMWQRHGDGVPVPETGFEELVAELVGEDLAPFFDQAVRSCEDLPMDQYLAAQGVSMKWESGDGAPAWLGCTYSATGNRVAVVYEGSPAQQAGLTPGDEVLAWQGVRFVAANESAYRRSAMDGDLVSLAVFRNDELIECEVTLAPPSQSVCVLDSKPGFESTRDQWLYSRA